MMNRADLLRAARRVRGRGLNATRARWLNTIPYALLIVLIVIYAVTLPAFLTMSAINLTIADGLALALVAIGQTIVIMSGGIDLSVGGLISLATVLMASEPTTNPGLLVLWIIAVCALGAVAGALNGLIVVYLRLQPFIATLATWSVWWGIALWIRPVDGGTISSRLLNWVNLAPASIGVPILLLIVALASWIWVRRARVIYDIKAIGSDEVAARLSGTNRARTLTKAYAASGALAACGGIFLSTQLASGSPNIGNDFILTSIAAAVIGGTSLFGGAGSPVASIVGGYVLSLVPAVVAALGFSSEVGSVARALVLIAAIAIVARGALIERRRAGAVT